MKSLIATLATLIAAPALAHPGAHMHPHAGDPSWMPILISGLVIAGAITVARARAK